VLENNIGAEEGIIESSCRSSSLSTTSAFSESRRWLERFVWDINVPSLSFWFIANLHLAFFHVYFLRQQLPLDLPSPPIVELIRVRVLRLS
jgi:hypothetical protein